MGLRVLTVAVTGLLALSLGATANAAVIDQKRAPKVSGALEPAERLCGSQPDPDGSATFRFCDYYYSVRPEADGDPDRDYFVLFSKVKVVLHHPCTRRYSEALVLSPEVAAHRTGPSQNRIKFRRTKVFNSKLRVRAKAGEQIGAVSARWKVRKGRLITKLGRRDEGNSVVKQAWRGGRTCGRVHGLAFGVELSRPTADPGLGSEVRMPGVTERGSR